MFSKIDLYNNLKYLSDDILRFQIKQVLKTLLMYILTIKTMEIFFIWKGIWNGKFSNFQNILQTLSTKRLYHLKCIKRIRK